MFLELFLSVTLEKCSSRVYGFVPERSYFQEPDGSLFCLDGSVACSEAILLNKCAACIYVNLFSS